MDDEFKLPDNVDGLEQMTRDLRSAARTLTDNEARFLVDTYYMMQDQRIRVSNQERSLGKADEPNSALSFFHGQFDKIELQLRSALDAYSAAHPIGQWMRSNKGVGPVIAAGLLAHIDISQCHVAGSIWSFAGLDPTKTWGKGQRRPWNAKLKTLCYKLGESFVKVQRFEDAHYSRLYVNRKKWEQEQNLAGAYADQAKAKLDQFSISKSTDAYKWYSGMWVYETKFNEQLQADINLVMAEQGLTQAEATDMVKATLRPRPMLPPAHIHARARRYAVKMFLSHLQQVWWEYQYNEPPPKPFAIAVLGHKDYVPPYVKLETHAN